MKTRQETNGKTKIGVDLDGVLFDFHTPFLKFYNEKHGTNFSVKDIKKYEFSGVFGISQKELNVEMSLFYQSDSFKNLPRVPGAQIAINSLSKKNTLGVITSRPDFTSNTTLISLDKNFPGCFSEVYFTSEYGGKGHRKKKSELCLDHRYGMMVEDVAEYANECAEKGISALLINQPWNLKEKLHPKVKRVQGWKEVLQYLQ